MGPRGRASRNWAGWLIVQSNAPVTPYFGHTAHASHSTTRAMGSVIVFVTPILLFYGVRLVGTMYASEFLLLAMLPILVRMRGHLLRGRLPMTVLLLGVLWLCAQVVTDIFRVTPFQDWSRGWSNIIVFLLDFVGVLLLINQDRRRIVLFTVGVAVGHLLAYGLAPTAFSIGDPWKFGYGWPITLLAMVVASSRRVGRRPWLRVLIIATIAGANLFMGARSTFLLCIFVGALVLLRSRSRRRAADGPSARSTAAIAAMVLASLAMLVALVQFYPYAASSGWLGAMAQQKYESQAGGKYGVLLGGRPEILASGQAVIDSPLLGHGSWAKDPKYAALLRERQEDLGYKTGSAPIEEEEVIPSHSYLFGAWVFSGFVGAVFWGWILFVTIRTVIRFYRSSRDCSPIIYYLSITLLWGSLFSNFSGQERMHVALYLCVIIFANREMSQKGEMAAKPRTGRSLRDSKQG